MKKSVLTVMLASTLLTAQAQEHKTPAWINNVKLSGYAMTQYQYSGQEGSKSNSFNLRMIRLALDGRILNDFYWKTQIQFNGNTSTLGSSPRVVDLFVEWQKLDYFRVKVGQFKRPFTFENPMNPIDQGFMSYGQNVLALAGFSDRNGSHASNGRDIGVQLQGDFLKNANGRYLFHYQAGVYNGQGINTKDVDEQKDIIGGIWVMPVKGMRIGVFGWEGSYARKGTWTTEENGEEVSHSGIRKLPQHRYAISGEYKANDWTFRSEYIHSTGKAFTTRYQDADDAKDCTVNESLGSEAWGYYALCIAPIIKNKLHAKARYDVYSSQGEWGKAKTLYEVGADYEFTRNLEISAEYARVNDRTLDKHNYNMVDVEVDFRF
ncbi:MAG: porin [Prevotella sp.]|jgi:hypothetical protein